MWRERWVRKSLFGANIILIDEARITDGKKQRANIGEEQNIHKS